LLGNVDVVLLQFPLEPEEVQYHIAMQEFLVNATVTLEIT